ncbi:hypothetical protein ACWDKQ_32575 [Saccharopolyspora sp. NPDC000995]
MNTLTRRALITAWFSVVVALPAAAGTAAADAGPGYGCLGGTCGLASWPTQAPHHPHTR